MERIISIKEALDSDAQSHILLDVRSPSEYTKGHLPNALSFPLFSDEERAIVGTLYKQQGKDIAFEQGIAFVGPKMAGFVKEARRLTQSKKKILVHCWRGGQRSRSMAWLLSQAGMQVEVLQGGYKAYRNHVLDQFDTIAHKLIVVGGKTGSGKTKVIHALATQGEQVIDLEGLAHHKGSAFGALGERAQPSNEQFENLLAEALRTLDIQKRVWVENESKSIGSVYLPIAFRKAMKQTALIHLDLDLESRLDILVEDYAKFAEGELKASFDKIEKKLGGLAHKQALDALALADHRTAAMIALQYYDKTYTYGLDENETPIRLHHKSQVFDAQLIAKAFISEANKKQL
jgi:tRNA 2-selenouridine synthase